MGCPSPFLLPALLASLLEQIAEGFSVPHAEAYGDMWKEQQLPFLLFRKVSFLPGRP